MQLGPFLKPRLDIKEALFKDGSGTINSGFGPRRSKREIGVRTGVTFREVLNSAHFHPGWRIGSLNERKREREQRSAMRQLYRAVIPSFATMGWS